MITTVIFDIGNVLMKFDYMPYVKGLLQDDHVIDKVNDAMWKTGYWNDLDLGEDCDLVFSRMVEAAPEYENEIMLTLKNVNRCMDKMDYAIPWVIMLKKRGYRVLFLSNYSEYIMNQKPEVLDFLPHMDGGIFSCYVGMIKPNPDIYKILCDKYGLNPAECVFIDDNEDNVNAARKFGLNAIHFKGYHKAVETLETYLQDKNEDNTEMSAIEYRKATIDEIDVLIDLRKRQLQDEGQSLDADIDESLGQYLYEKMTANELTEFVAEMEGKIIATAALIVMEYPPSFANPSGYTGYVANVYTEDAFRGRGIAGKMLGIVEQEARQRGITRLLLYASKMGYNTYQKSGYKKTDTVMEKNL